MNVRQTIIDHGGVLEGEFFFAYKSGKVGQKYINMDPLFTYPKVIQRLARKLIDPFVYEKIDTIVGPAVGGIPLVFGALCGTRMEWIRTAWADKQNDGTFAFERMGFESVVRGKRVGVVEDITTTGSSARAVGTLVEKLGGTVVGYSFIWNRGNISTRAMGAPVFSLVSEGVPSWDPGGHPSWGKWPLVADIGHPDKFPNYPAKRINLLKAA